MIRNMTLHADDHISLSQDGHSLGITRGSLDDQPRHSINREDISICWIHHPEQLSGQIPSRHIYDVCIVSLHAGIEAAYHMTTWCRSRHRCPIGVSSQSQAVEFCRQIMLHHHGIPKYIMRGQSLVRSSS